jgi:hypothetical protein
MPLTARRTKPRPEILMFEHIHLPPLPDDDDAERTLAASMAAADPDAPSVSTPVPIAPAFTLPATSPPVPPAEAIELIARGLAPGADESTLSAARELWTRVAHLLVPTPATPVLPPPMPVLPPLPTNPIAPLPVAPGGLAPKLPPTPIATVMRALQQTPPDQLLELLLGRLRAALPSGATAPAPAGIQFQLIPMSSPPPAR